MDLKGILVVLLSYKQKHLEHTKLEETKQNRRKSIQICNMEMLNDTDEGVKFV